jgi:colanic acid biosynthesis glycosyl transferase WcaI
MKILFLSDNFYPESNAAASRVYERAVFWARDGHDVTVMTGCPNFPEGKPFPGYKNRWRYVETIDGIRVVRVKTYMAANQGVGRRLVDFLSYMVSATFFSLFEKRPDLVMASSPQFFTAVAGYLVSVFKRCPYGLEVADLWPESIRGVGAMRDSFFLSMVENLELFLYRRATFIVTLTESIKQNIVKRKIDPYKITTIINGVNLERFKPAAQKDPELETELGLNGKFVVGYIGTLGLAHGLENLLKAAQLAEQEGCDDLQFLIVGGGAEAPLLKEIQRQQGLKNVTILGRQDKAEIARYWSLCDLALVHLKNSDVFKTVIPSKIFEAMALGKPILYCGPESDGSEVVTKEKVGERVDSGNPQTLWGRIQQLAENPEKLTQYQTNMKEVVPRYSRRQQSKLMIKLMDSYLFHSGSPFQRLKDTPHPK